MNKNTMSAKFNSKMIAAAVAVIVVGALLAGGLVNGLFTNKKQDTTMQQQAAQIQSKDISVGSGDIAVAGKQVTVNYTGVFADGKKFDSSLDAGRTPFTFVLGSGMVIKGWDIGVEGMKVGGKRILIIPPQFGYGDKDYGPIPGNSTLIFQIELLSVK